MQIKSIVPDTETMKRVFCLILAICSSLIIAEGIIRYVIQYPAYGVECFIEGLDIVSAKNGRLYKPYAKLWSVEGGNKIIQKNNIGLPGADIKIADNSKYIFLMGTSFIEALETPRDKIASYLFYQKLMKIDPNYQVVNIAYRNNDPYAQYFRLKYYMGRFKPHAGILVIDSVYPKSFWKSRYGKNLSFETKPNRYRKITSLKVELPRIVRNTSAFINLAVRLFSTSNKPETDIVTPAKTAAKTQEEQDYSIYQSILSEMNTLLDGKLIVACITGDESKALAIQKICHDNNILYAHKNLMIKANRLDGNGHLNTQGNQELGSFLFEQLQVMQ